MIQYLECFYREHPMGVMSWETSRAEGWFEFQPTFWHSDISFSPLLFPNHLRSGKPPLLPLGGNKNQTRGLPPFFADALPGKYACTLLDYALKPSGKSVDTLSPLAWCSLLGIRGMGVFRFDPSGYPELDAVASVDIGQLVRHTNLLVQSEKKLSDNRLRELLRSGLFTVGETPAAWVSVNDFTGEVISGQSPAPHGFDAWVIHLDGVHLQVEGKRSPDNPRERYAHHQKALSCGLDVLPCRLIHEGQQTHVLSKRLDRKGGNPVHVQSYKALREESGPEAADSCEGLFRCLRLLRLPYNEQVEWYKRVVFNGLISNRQDSAEDVFFEYKNDSTWHLASYSGFPPSLSENMTLNGKSKDWTLDDYRLLGKQQHIRRFENVIQEISRHVSV